MRHGYCRGCAHGCHSASRFAESLWYFLSEELPNCCCWHLCHGHRLISIQNNRFSLSEHRIVHFFDLDRMQGIDCRVRCCCVIATMFLLKLKTIWSQSIRLFSLEVSVNPTVLIFGPNDLDGGIALPRRKEIAYKSRHSIHSCFLKMFYIDQMFFFFYPLNTVDIAVFCSNEWRKLPIYECQIRASVIWP